MELFVRLLIVVKKKKKESIKKIVTAKSVSLKVFACFSYFFVFK